MARIKNIFHVDVLFLVLKFKKIHTFGSNKSFHGSFSASPFVVLKILCIKSGALNGNMCGGSTTMSVETGVNLMNVNLQDHNENQNWEKIEGNSCFFWASN